MTDVQSIQLAVEAVLGVVCVAGYLREAAVAREIRSGPPRNVAPALEVRAVGDGEWVVLGISEETSFDTASAIPELVSSGFELDGPQGRIAIAQGTKVMIRGIADARRVPHDALVTTDGVKPRLTFEVRPGAVLYCDVTPPNPHVYRADTVTRDAIVLGGTAAAVTSARTTIEPGCWIVLLLAGVLGAIFATASGWPRLAWVVIGLTATAVALGWLVMPSANDRLAR